MGSGFRRQVRRVGTAGVVLAAAFLLASPGSAHAAEPVVAGSCDATLKGEDGKPLTVDLGAAANSPGVLDVGLGSGSGALVSLPVSDALDRLGVSRADLVVDPAGRICDTGQRTLNTVAAPVQQALPEEGVVPPPPPPEGPDEPEPDDPGDPGGDEPAPDPGAPGDETPGGGSGTGPDENLPGGTGSGNPQGGSPFGGSPFGGPLTPVSAFSGLDPITIPPAASIPPVAPPAAPDLGQPDAGAGPDVRTEDSGTAQALPSAEAPDRLPLLLAVVALVLVIAALARTWLRRKAL
ncbi:hypothetical protein [Prauserella muralis]|uniref:Uncharacterized protein n=1 Tax=Prauserella muralis TaxID=588067 RepID=A0A2V4BAS4_9PSEU|nr:hypothetical protein [Prauserella muralis]PXY31622.1 hypothetical protein BAY60_04445 [Prauserella muralis]TWE14013.1 hypothetical protein FHX69_6147 [Prauserella muralis]